MKKLALLGMLLLLAGTCLASTMTFTTLTNWSAATGPYQSFSTSTGAWPAGVTVNAENPNAGFQTPGSLLVNGLPAGCFGCAFTGTVWEDRLTPDPNPYSTTFNFATAQTAFGATWDLYGPGGAGDGINVFLNGTLVGLIDHNTNGSFWGFTSTTPFTSITLVADGQLGSAETYDIGNVYTKSVPEPSSLLLLGSGFLGLSGYLRRRRR